MMIESNPDDGNPAINNYYCHSYSLTQVEFKPPEASPGLMESKIIGTATMSMGSSAPGVRVLSYTSQNEISAEIQITKSTRG
jgi:hypothetical protein